MNVVASINKYKRRYYNYSWLFHSIGRQNYIIMKKYQNSAKGKRCFILGNGPSLMKCQLSNLKDEITIASNGIFLIFDKMGFKPTFLTVEDGLVAEDRADELNHITGITKIYPYDLAKWLKQDNDSIYCNFFRGFKDMPRFSKNFAKKVFWGGTVSYLNLQLAYYLGCNEIYLIGFDHNYKVKDPIDKEVIVSQRKDENHFHPGYFGPGYRWHDPKVWRMELAYTVARKFFEDHNIKVSNATVGGKLEVFKRVDYNSLF